MKKFSRGFIAFFLFSSISIAFSSMPLRAFATSPVAANRTMVVNEDNSRSVSLTATSTTRNETFTYTLTSQPSHGSVALSGSTATYTPTANFFGVDSFTYAANGSVSGVSNAATVSITVSAVNDVPVASTTLQTMTSKNIAVSFALTGTDVDGDPLTCSITGATGGTATSSGCTATFTPSKNMTGTAQVYFKVYDGKLYSALATAIITVNSTNVSPVASNISASGTEDVPMMITALATDGDSDALTFVVQAAPLHGSVTFSGARATYTPSANFNGMDTFTYVANDGKVNSNVATVSVTLTAVNDTPVANGGSVSTDSATPVTISFNASDVDGDALTYRVSTLPAQGTVSTVSGNTVVYTPNADQYGVMSFVYTVADGSRSASATVFMMVYAAPVAHALAIAALENTPVTIHPFVTDHDSAVLTVSMQSSPSHGSLVVQSNGDWLYTPNQDWFGMDVYTYVGNDGAYASMPATVRINVNQPSGLPGVDIIQAGVNFVHLDVDSFAPLNDLGVQAVRQIGNADTTWLHVLAVGGQAIGADATAIRQAAHMYGIGTVDTLFEYATSSCTPPWNDAFDPMQFVRTPDTLCMNYLSLVAQEVKNDSTIAGGTFVRPHVDVGNENYHWVTYDDTITYTPEQQAVVIKAAADTVRSAVPGAIINEPSIAFNDSLSGDWATRVHAAAGTDWFDQQTVHAYDRWEWYPAELASFFASDRYVSGKMVDVTETGRSSDPTGTRTPDNTEEKKVAAVFQNFSMFWGAGMNSVYWHSFLGDAAATSDLRGMGLVDVSGTYDTAAYAYKLLTSELVPFREVATLSDDITTMEYAFTNPAGVTKYVVWGSEAIQVPVGVTQMVSVLPSADGSYVWGSVVPGQMIQLQDTPYLLK